MFMPCDIFAPCADHSTLNVNNAANLKAKIVIEGANGPTTYGADKILEQKNI
jgi:glutamate dehydrogenase (NAD(P)+)